MSFPHWLSSFGEATPFPAALAELFNRVPNLPDRKAREAVALVIARAVSHTRGSGETRTTIGPHLGRRGGVLCTTAVLLPFGGLPAFLEWLKLMRVTGSL